MSLSETAWQARIVAELGDSPGTTDALAGHVAALWAGADEYAATPKMRYLVAKLDAIDFLLGRMVTEQLAPVEQSFRSETSERRANLLAIRSALTLAIGRRRAGRAPAVAPQTLNGPIPSRRWPVPVPDYADPNDPVYGGEPAVAPFWVQRP